MTQHFEHQCENLPQQSGLDTLFIALPLTLLAIFVTGHLSIARPEVLFETLPLLATLLALCFTFFLFSRALNTPLGGLLGTYGLLFAITYGWRPVFVTLLIIAAFLGAHVFWKHLKASSDQWIQALCIALFSALFVIKYAHSDFDVFRHLQEGIIHRDTLWHASIASMLKNYGVASLGIHGLVEIPYHFLSHTLIAGISATSNVPVLLVYGIAHWAFFVPILLFGLTLSTLSLTSRQPWGPVFIWGLACAILFAQPALVNSGTRNLLAPTFSESYVLATGLFLMGLPLLLKPSWNLTNWGYMVALGIALAHAKASWGLVFLALLGLRVFRLSGKRLSRDWLIFVVLAGLIYLVVGESARSTIASSNEGGIRFNPLSHFRHYAYYGEQIIQFPGSQGGTAQPSIRSLWLSVKSVSIFVFWHFLFSWICIVWFVLKNGFSGLWASAMGSYTAFATAIGVTLLVLFEFPEESGYFFYNIPFFVSLPLVLAGLVYLVNSLLIRFSNGIAFSLVVRWGGVGLAMAIALHVTQAWSERTARFDQSAPLPCIGRLRDIQASAPINIVWRLNTRECHLADCLSCPFLYPAVSERPWIGGIEAHEPCDYRHYGFSILLSQSNPVRMKAAYALPTGALIKDFN